MPTVECLDCGVVQSKGMASAFCDECGSTRFRMVSRAGGDGKT